MRIRNTGRSRQKFSFRHANGILMKVSGQFALTDGMIDQLENFSLLADDDTYSVYLDNGGLVIY